MNKKQQYQILVAVLIVIVIFNVAVIFTSNSPHDNIYNVTTVGKNANGTVYKIIAGNPSSNETVGIILGVHPREHEMHEAVNNTIHNITSENGDRNLTKKYVIYYVKVKDNLTSRDDTRAAGEALAHKYIVPKIKKDNPFIVVDVHEIDPIYEYSNFLFSLSNRTEKIDSYIDKLSKDIGVVDFNFTEGTSPEKVTMPIAEKGITTILLETSITDDYAQKQDAANRLIRSLDKLEP
ncbi:MAG: hypothetical protein IJL02_08775 [Methanobrevibacter sp.]|uniref:hypothetical protein n=1 Tax=Methanobrevibacter sp. TaxID=66852 RepID=UPI0025EBAF7E|nr:hypothetical protein [Methanobrevibacter sp.]MBQ6099931.1 hypothetical protein [Methanobrevibacter sp.]